MMCRNFFCDSFDWMNCEQRLNMTEYTKRMPPINLYELLRSVHGAQHSLCVHGQVSHKRISFRFFFFSFCHRLHPPHVGICFEYILYVTSHLTLDTDIYCLYVVASSSSFSPVASIPSLKCFSVVCSTIQLM